MFYKYKIHSVHKKKIMILGAGIYQVPAIQKAREMGFEVITVDYLPDNIGHRYSNHYVNLSTTESSDVLKAAREFKIDGIMTLASDIATTTATFVAKAMNLCGAFHEAALVMSNKSCFRDFQKKNGFPFPCFFMAQEYEGIKTKLKSLSFPVMLKPDNSSGSRGIVKIETPSNLIREIFEDTKKFSRTKTVCIEEFIPGIEVGGDAFFLNGKPVFIGITHKHKYGYLVKGHSLPTNISENSQKRIHDMLSSACQKLGYLTGPLNFDIMVGDDRITILEISPRIGGNGIPILIHKYWGVDLIEQTIRYVMGEITSFPALNPPFQKCGSYIFGIPQGGILKAIIDPSELNHRIPEIFQSHYNFKPGDRVPPFVHNGNSLGIVFFNLINIDYDEMTQVINHNLDIVLR